MWRPSDDDLDEWASACEELAYLHGDGCEWCQHLLRLYDYLSELAGTGVEMPAVDEKVFVTS